MKSSAKQCGYGNKCDKISADSSPLASAALNRSPRFVPPVRAWVTARDWCGREQSNYGMELKEKGRGSADALRASSGSGWRGGRYSGGGGLRGSDGRCWVGAIAAAAHTEVGPPGIINPGMRAVGGGAGGPLIRPEATFSPLGEKDPMDASAPARELGVGTGTARTEPRPPGMVDPGRDAVGGLPSVPAPQANTPSIGRPSSRMGIGRPAWSGKARD